MKKFYILYLIIFIPLLLNAQTKRVAFEEFTNASCGPCAASNPTLKAWLGTKGDSVITLIYRTSWPGFDPMYNYNVPQLEERRSYYSGVTAVPWLKADGNVYNDIWPFSFANFDNAFYNRIVVVPPLDISVSDERIAGGDSNRVTISVHNFNSLPAGNYKLRVFAVERRIEYQTPPGSNGETVFEYVFRKGVPDMEGITIPAGAGTYDYQFTYYMDPVWQNNRIYTAAFVQNDASPQKEIVNINKADQVTSISNISATIPDAFSLSQNYPNPFNPATKIKFTIPKESKVRLYVYDVLGKTVADVVNENLIAGVYEIQFDASMLSTGIYFYKLEADGFTDVKKMMVIK
jgi:hypothetical protein